MPPWRSLSCGHFALASCTRFSPNTRWPCTITGSIASAPNVFAIATSVTEAGSRRASLHARPISPRTLAKDDSTTPASCSGRIVKNDSQRIAVTRANAADAMAHVHAVAAARAPHGPMMHGKDHGLALSKRHDLSAGLHPRPLLREHEFAAAEIAPRT